MSTKVQDERAACSSKPAESEAQAGLTLTDDAQDASSDLTQLHKNGAKAWADVPDATAWVDGLRGNSLAELETVVLSEIEKAVLVERERCALVCEAKHADHAYGPDWNSEKAQASQDCADEIRKGPQSTTPA